MIVDLMVHDAYLGYQEENWKDKRPSEVSEGKSVGSVTAEGMAQAERCSVFDRRSKILIVADTWLRRSLS